MKTLPPPIRLTLAQFDSMHEYNRSLPTGTTIGKRWKAFYPNGQKGHKWFMGEYTRYSVRPLGSSVVGDLNPTDRMGPLINQRCPIEFHVEISWYTIIIVVKAKISTNDHPPTIAFQRFEQQQATTNQGCNHVKQPA